jgi:hypothetical protein
MHIIHTQSHQSESNYEGCIIYVKILHLFMIVSLSMPPGPVHLRSSAPDSGSNTATRGIGAGVTVYGDQRVCVRERAWLDASELSQAVNWVHAPRISGGSYFHRRSPH